MIRFEKRFFINRAPPEVFAYLTDPASYPEWQATTESAVLTSPGPLGIGSTIHATGKVLGRKMEVDMLVTAYDPPRRYSFTTTGGPAQGEMDHRLSAEGTGTSLTVIGKVEVGGLFEKLLSRQVEARVEEDARRLKARLEVR